MSFTGDLRFRNIVLLIVALLLAGCSLSKLKPVSSSSNSSTGNAARTATAFKPSDDARKDLGEALGKLKTAYPYRLTETTTNDQSATQPTIRVAEFAGADRSHVKLSGGNTTDNIEMIAIGDKEYWYADGKWTENARQSATRKTKAGEDLEKMLASATKDVKLVGPETVNGVPCFAYTYSMEINESGNKYAGTGKAWIGAADGLPHQIDSEFNVGGFNQKSHIVYEYNVDLKVEKPIP